MRSESNSRIPLQAPAVFLMKKYFIFFIIAWVIFIFHAVYTKHAIYGDGNGYYSYTQAIYFDKSLNFTNIYKHLEHFQGKNYEFSRIFWDRSFNPYSIGTGVVWLPSMFLMSFFSSDRFDLIYELGPGLTGIICMMVGLYFIEKTLRKRFSNNVVNWTILSLFFGSNILYYTAFEPALSHQPAFMIVSILLYLASNRGCKGNLFLVGLLSGFLVNVRIGDVILLLPILYLIKKQKSHLLIFLGGFIAGIAPQLFNQAIQYKGIFDNPYTNGSNGIWAVNITNAFNTLFSIKRGLFTWTPIWIFGVYGLIKNKHFVFLITLIFYWLVASFWSGNLSAGFGLRLMFSGIPYLAIGVAEVFINMTNKKIIWTSLFLSFYNLILLCGFYFLGWKNLP